MVGFRKNILIILLASVIVLSLALVACEPAHKHIVDGWNGDGESHWRECACGEKIGKSEKHSVADWTVDVPASETATGSRHGTCTTCGRNVVDVIPKLDHAHDFGGDYQYDENVHFKRCAGCNQTGESEAHTVSVWTTSTPATEQGAGVESGECSVCHAQLTRAIPPLLHTHDYALTYSHNENSHWRKCNGCQSVTDAGAHTESAWITDKEATVTDAGSKHTECTVCGRVIATDVVPQLTQQTRYVDLYAINDFHGAVDRISTVGGYLKGAKNSNPDTVLINSGDMFQGSMESNSNYGKLLADCMDAIGFDAFVYGNHEFDWGLGKMQALAHDGSTPFLGANIYHWNANTRTWGDFADEIAQQYVIKELDNGLKVGIIGVIGQSQITSISSNLVQDIGFKNPIPIIKDLATELRNRQGCDLVVVSAHVGATGLVGSGDGNGPSNAAGLQNYVDAVFCAHTHQQEIFVVDGLPFIQGGSYGRYVSHVKLSVDGDGKVGCPVKENVPYSSSWDNLHVVDTLVDNSNSQIQAERNSVVSNFDATLDYNTQIPRLVCRAMANYAVQQGHDIALAMTNNARSSIFAGEVTFAELYEAIPFDNVVYVASVSGEDILKEAGYNTNSVWRVSGEAIEADGYYNIAVIDYLLFHQNSSRYYDYFPSAFRDGAPKPVALTNSNVDGDYNYRLITRDYLLSVDINVYDYIYDNLNVNKSMLQTSVTLDYSTASVGDSFVNLIPSGIVAVLPSRLRFAA